MIIEGKNSIIEAIKGGVTIEKLCVQKGMAGLERIVQDAKRKNIKVVFSEKQYMQKLSPSGRHQGVLAIATDFSYTAFDELLYKEGKKLVIVLDGVEDPHNLGAVVRVADCAGATGVVVPKYRASGVTDTVVKVSAGATAYVPIAKVTNTNDAIRKLKEEGVKVIAADMDGKPMYDCDMTVDIAIVVGGEGKGVHDLTKKLCDEVVAIPQFGKVNSLNASVATAVVTYECIRQRTAK